MGKSAIIIGAGIGGLSASIRLRTQGWDVKVFEKNALVGGKMYQQEIGGYRWDTGPSVITMRHVLEDLFASAGKNLSDYVTLRPLNPLTRYFFADGSQLDISAELSKTMEQIASVDEHDVEGYLAYLSYAARIHRITGKVFIYDQPPTLASFAKVPVTEWLGADPLRTMQQAINGFVRSPQLRQLLGRFATYVGGSPFLAPATLNVIAHVELTGGVWYPVGGIYQIAKALEQLARELGVEIHTNRPIQEIIVHNQVASGVMTADQQQHLADVIIANADVTSTLNQLLPKNTIAPARLERLNRYEASCSGFIMLLGIAKNHPELAHHNLFFSDDYQTEFNAIFKTLVPSDNPSLYVCITSKTDATHAPSDHENWFVMVNTPPLSTHYSWQKNREAYENLVLAKLAERGYDVRPHIREKVVLTPEELQNHSGAWRGALYGPSANQKFTAFVRPKNRSRDIRGLYFVGGTTHPGGGVPMVMLSAKVVASMVREDFA